MPRRYVVLTAVLTFLAPDALDAQAKVGTAAGQFLGIPVGSKAIAMGGAYVAMPFDATALYWNPGGVAQIHRSQLAVSSTSWLAGSQFRWAGVVLQLDGANAFGLSFTQLDYGDEEVTTVRFPDGTGERWTAEDLAIALTYSRALTDRFSLGGSVKYIGQRVWNETASTFALDLGLLFVTGFNNLRLAMAISNFGGDLTLDGRDLLNRVDIDPDNSGSNKTLVGKLKTDPWPLPLFFRVGVAMEAVELSGIALTLSADAVRPSDNAESVNVGAQLSWNDVLFARAGYRNLLRNDSEETITLGGGVRITLPGFGALDVHYGYYRFGLFGSLNSIDVGIAF